MSSEFIVPRLSYEILNIPLVEIADNMGLPVRMLEAEAEKYHWKPWFPDDDEAFSLVVSEDEADSLEGTNIFTVKADQFLERSRKKLQVFNMAKEMAFIEKYSQLELNLLDKANDAVSDMDSTDVKSLKEISSLFKDLARNLVSGSSAVSLTQDESGLPTVIIRDLSGT